MASLAARQILRTTIAKLRYEVQNAPTYQLTIPRVAPRPLGPLQRPFTTTSALSKKGGKKSSRRGEEDEEIEEEAPTKRGKGGKSKKVLDEDFLDSPRKSKGKGNKSQESEIPGEEIDPFDLSILSDSIEQAAGDLKLEISRLPTGGKFSTSSLEDLNVQYDKQDNLSAKLKSIADVLPKGGRTVTVLMYNKEHIKAIKSAIQGASSLNLGQPIQNAHNELQLDIPIPPPTKESRDQGIKMIVQAGEKAGNKVRDARAAMQKKFRSMKLDKTVRPDDLVKAQKEMEEVVKKGVAEITKIVDAAKLTMSGSNENK